MLLYRKKGTWHYISYTTYKPLIGAELAEWVRSMTLYQEFPGSNLVTNLLKNSACAVGQGTLSKGFPGGFPG